MIKVINEIEPYEIDDNELVTIKSKKPLLIVMSHWNRNEFVVLKFGENRNSITVRAKDLISAIENSTNSSRI